MAVIDAMSFPIIHIVEELIVRVDIDDEAKEKIRREYISKAIELSLKERKFGAGKFKNEILEAIYGKEHEQEMKVVVAKLSLGGRAANVELTSDEMAYVASVIMKTYKEKYEDSQRKFAKAILNGRRKQQNPFPNCYKAFPMALCGW